MKNCSLIGRYICRVGDEILLVINVILNTHSNNLSTCQGNKGQYGFRQKDYHVCFLLILTQNPLCPPKVMEFFNLQFSEVPDGPITLICDHELVYVALRLRKSVRLLLRQAIRIHNWRSEDNHFNVKLSGRISGSVSFTFS